jgi:hypothetical protein
MKSGELQTRSRAEYIDEIAAQSTTVRIIEAGPSIAVRSPLVEVELFAVNDGAFGRHWAIESRWFVSRWTVSGRPAFRRSRLAGRLAVNRGRLRRDLQRTSVG